MKTSVRADILLCRPFPKAQLDVTECGTKHEGPVDMAICIKGGRVLTADGTFSKTDVTVADNTISAVGEIRAPSSDLALNAEGKRVLPGIVDIHGDAFERQIMPRAGVHIPLAPALIDTDRQMLASGITTAFHSVTYSWEPGLRGRDNCVALLDAMKALKSILACDTRFHLRFETYNLDAVDEVCDWMKNGDIDLLAFNDHTPKVLRYLDSDNPAIRKKLNRDIDRTGLSADAFEDLANRVRVRAGEVPKAIEKLATVARESGIAQLSHDDASPAMRDGYQKLGCAIAEFPLTLETTQHAAKLGNAIVFGGPNVMRGGSHMGGVNAAEMVQDGLCTVLASDYYYPSLLHAAYRLVAEKRTPSFAEAWALISANPARAAGLNDRGVIDVGKRADLIVIDDSNPDLLRVEAVIAGGKLHSFGAKISPTV